MDVRGASTIQAGRRPAAVLVTAALAALALAGASSARGATLPNPCTILALAHPQGSIGSASVSVKPGKLTTYGTGKYEQLTCNETVGTITVYLSYYFFTGGSGGVRVTSRSHPAGLGSEGELTVGTGAGNGAPVDYVSFKKGSLYADLGANGAEPSGLTTFAREVYKLTP
jgi:hypothetical protein